MFVKSLFHWFRQRPQTAPSPHWPDSTPSHLILPSLSVLVYNSVLSQSQSVRVIPLRGTRPEATPVWDRALCWLNCPPHQLHFRLSQPSQPRLSTLLKLSLYKSGYKHKIVLFENLDSGKKKQWNSMWEKEKERSGTGGLNTKSSQVIQVDFLCWEEMTLIPATFQCE